MENNRRGYPAAHDQRITNFVPTRVRHHRLGRIHRPAARTHGELPCGATDQIAIARRAHRDARAVVSGAGGPARDERNLPSPWGIFRRVSTRGRAAVDSAERCERHVQADTGW